MRQGNKAAACKIYDDAVAAAADKGSSSEKTYAFLVVSYAHFLVQSFKDVDAARSLYASALQQAPGSLSLWEGAIHLEENLDAPVRSLSGFWEAYYPCAISIFACDPWHAQLSANYLS